MNIKCQVFTPEKHVKELLDIVGYQSKLMGKKIIENSCGDGNILKEIVRRYINDSLKQNVSLKDIKIGLENDIFGAEIDNRHIIKCKEELNKLVLTYGLPEIDWNILEGDFLAKHITGTYDYVVGNPPYITYRDLPSDVRKYVHDNYQTCVKGKFDYYYAFIEASIKSLKPKGKLAYLIPSNIYKNQFGKAIREFILPSLTHIFDYQSQKLFNGKLTSSTIILCELGVNFKEIYYKNMELNQSFTINKEVFQDKWQFQSSKLKRLSGEHLLKFSDYFHTANSIATLYNKAFIINNFIEEENYLLVGRYKIEKSILRLSASPRSMLLGRKEYIIFPYYYEANKLYRYSENEFNQKFPYAKEYLQQFTEQLSNRSSESNINWYEYGRSQALLHLNQEKLMLSTLITHKPNLYLLSQDTIPTAGFYIIPKSSTMNLTQAKDILSSTFFLDYVKSIGIISNGNSFRIAARDINDFQFFYKLNSLT